MSTADVSVVEDVERAHREVLTALVDGDTTALDRLVAEDCQIIGPKGYKIGKDEWVRTHSSQVYQQVLLEAVESENHQYGDTAIRTDLQRSECRYAGELIAGLYRVLNVWVRSPRGWQLAAIQYTTVSDAAAAGLG